MYKGTTNIWQMIVYEKIEEEEWHKKMFVWSMHFLWCRQIPLLYRG